MLLPQHLLCACVYAKCLCGVLSAVLHLCFGCCSMSRTALMRPPSSSCRCGWRGGRSLQLVDSKRAVLVCYHGHFCRSLKVSSTIVTL
jgi:hypothetical protein